MFKKLIRYRDAKCIEGKGEPGGGIPLFSSPGNQKERHSFPSGVWVGALAENKNDFGAFCTRKTDFSEQKFIKRC